MKLQLALDGNLQQGLAALEAAAPYIDIAEIGTPLIFREGVRAVREVRSGFPQVTLVADLKIMDAGEEEAGIAFGAGADLVTVLGVANDTTVRGAVAAAQRAGKQVMADLMQVNDPVARGRDLLQMGCQFVCVHTAYDMLADGHSPLEILSRLRGELPDARLAVAGGINLSNLEDIVALKPDIVVVGSAITRAADMAGTAQALRSMMREWE
jgi:3-hexulose-6-phosphate synthase